MIRNIALALTIAAISTSAAAQTQKPTWDDYLKPYAAKTDPAVPIAAPTPKPQPQPVSRPAPERINDVVYIYELIRLIHNWGYYCTGNVSAYMQGIDGSYGPTVEVVCPAGDRRMSYYVSEPVPGRGHIVRVGR